MFYSNDLKDRRRYHMPDARFTPVAGAQADRARPLKTSVQPCKLMNDLLTANRMILSLIVAMAQNRVIGRNNRLPWHLPADLKWFKQITLGKPILMGRKTHESIGRPLPGRTNIVITRRHDYPAEGCIVAHSLAEAVTAAGTAEEIIVIGGASLYAQVLPWAARIYLTLVQAEPAGDTWFPALDPQDWQEVWREDHPADARHAYPYSFLRLERAVGLTQSQERRPGTQVNR